eukprot:scaffold6711_cov118-Isochrysis_galbana.AAC.3
MHPLAPQRARPGSTARAAPGGGTPHEKLRGCGDGPCCRPPPVAASARFGLGGAVDTAAAVGSRVLIDSREAHAEHDELVRENLGGADVRRLRAVVTQPVVPKVVRPTAQCAHHGQIHGRHFRWNVRIGVRSHMLALRGAEGWARCQLLRHRPEKFLHSCQLQDSAGAVSSLDEDLENSDRVAPLSNPASPGSAVSRGGSPACPGPV